MSPAASVAAPVPDRAAPTAFRRAADVLAADGGDAARRWGAFLRNGGSGSVFLDPRLVLPLGSEAGGDLVYMATARAAEAGGELTGLAVLNPRPVKVRVAPRLVPPVALTGYRLVGSQVVTAGGDEPAVAAVRAFARLLADGPAECLVFEDIEVDSPLWRAIRTVTRERSVTAFYHRGSQPHHWIRFPDPPADYWKKFSGKTRSTLRRKATKFEHTLVKYTAPDDVPKFLEQAHRVSARSWQGNRLGVRVANSPAERAMWGAVADVGAFRSYVLEHQGNPVAFLLGTCWNGFYNYEEVGYDQDFSRHSPGTVLLYRAIEDLIAHDTPHTLDFSYGDADHKQLFGNTVTRTGQVVLARRSARPVAAPRLEQASFGLARAARAALRRTGFLTYLRRKYRRPDSPAAE
jgi:CelD/BcsL family acetyltransferase involved in cellulose biosynthesis